MILASCPVCGKGLFRGAPNSQIEGNCPKCKEFIKIAYAENGFNAVAANFTGENYNEFKKNKEKNNNNINTIS